MFMHSFSLSITLRSLFRFLSHPLFLSFSLCLTHSYSHTRTHTHTVHNKLELDEFSYLIVILQLFRTPDSQQTGPRMLLILDGNSEISAHVRSNFWYLISLRHLIRSSEVKNPIFFFRKDLFLFMRAQHVLNNHLM